MRRFYGLNFTECVAIGLILRNICIVLGCRLFGVMLSVPPKPGGITFRWIYSGGTIYQTAPPVRIIFTLFWEYALVGITWPTPSKLQKSSKIRLSPYTCSRQFITWLGEIMCICTIIRLSIVDLLSSPMSGIQCLAHLASVWTLGIWALWQAILKH